MFDVYLKVVSWSGVGCVASFSAKVTSVEFLMAEVMLAVSLLAEVTSAESYLSSVLLCFFNMCILKLFIHLHLN